MSGGELYELPMSAPLTDESVYSSLLPTPVSQDVQKQPEAHLAKKVESGAGETITSLTVMTRQYAATGEWSNKLLPTPAAADGERGPDYAAETRDGTGGDTLVTTIAKLLPTPISRDGKGGNTPGDSLPDAVTLLPTPTREADSGGYNPAWGHGTTLADAARIIETGTPIPTGVSIPPPSDDGKPSPEPPHDQLTIGAA
jgi:hypothetical protein